MTRIVSPASAAVSSFAQIDNWRDIPVHGQSTDPAQTVRATIGFSVDPSWYVHVNGVASRGGQVTVELNKEKFQAAIAPGQLSGATVASLKRTLNARGYDVEVSGVEKPTLAQLVVLKAQLAAKEQILRNGGLEGVKLYRLKTEIEVLQSQVANEGFFTMVVQPAKT